LYASLWKIFNYSYENFSAMNDNREEKNPLCINLT
jgi:hypothetical protein